MDTRTKVGNEVLFLTVDHNGNVRLWPTPGAAMDNRGPTEVMVRLPLVSNQMKSIARAQLLAAERHGRS